MAQHKVTNVGIAGPTGRFGSLVLDALLENLDIKVRALCRNASKLDRKHTESTQLQVIEGDVLDQSTLDRFVDGLDVVICAYLGDNDFMLNARKALIDACEHTRVPRNFSSDFTFDYTKHEYGEHPGKDPVKKVYEYLKGKEHVQGVHVLVGAFIETFWSGYFQVWQPEEKALVYWGSGEEVWEFTTYPDSARYTAAVPLDSSAVGLQRFLGDKKTIPEIAQAFEKAYGFKPKLQCEGSVDELYAKLQRLLAEDPANVYAWLPFCYHYHILNGRTLIADRLDNAKYPQRWAQSMH